MPFPVTKSIAEGDVAATLRSVLNEVKKQNGVCTALSAFRIEKLGTVDARVVLSFDDDACKPKDA